MVLPLQKGPDLGQQDSPRSPRQLERGKERRPQGGETNRPNYCQVRMVRLNHVFLVEAGRCVGGRPRVRAVRAALCRRLHRQTADHELLRVDEPVRVQVPRVRHGAAAGQQPREEASMTSPKFWTFLSKERDTTRCRSVVMENIATKC